MHEATVAVYEANAAEYRRRRQAHDLELADGFRASLGPGGLRLDLGCGPGLYAPLLGRPLVATDAALAMCREVRRSAPDVAVARHDLVALPFRDRSFAGIWAWKCLQHVPADQLPAALGELHRCLHPGGRLDVALFRSGQARVHEELSDEHDDFPGRLFTFWEPEPFAGRLTGAGFAVDALAVTEHTIKATATATATAT